VPQPPSLCEPGLPSNLRLPRTHNASASNLGVSSMSSASGMRQTGKSPRSPSPFPAEAGEGPREGANSSDQRPPNERALVTVLSSESSGTLHNLSTGSRSSSRNALGQAEFVSDCEVRQSRNCWDRLVQQERVSSNRPLWFYQKSTQWKLAGFCSIIFFAMGFFMLTTAGKLIEVTLSYNASSVFTRFVVESDLQAPALMWYQLPHINLNNKLIVSSKDDILFSSTFIPYKCDGAETRDEMMYRRGYADPEFANMTKRSGNIFSPCGLMAAAMFTDRYALYSCPSTTTDPADCVGDASLRIYLNQSAVAHEADKVIFEKRIDMKPDGSIDIVGSKETRKSWLRADNLMHFQVWSRPPPAMHVRNLWAVLDDGLAAGSYVLHYEHNSPIWTENYDIPEKTIILAEGSYFGSRNACYMVGVSGICIALVELVMMCLLVAIPAHVAQSLGITTQFSGISNVDPPGGSSPSGGTSSDPPVSRPSSSGVKRASDRSE